MGKPFLKISLSFYFILGLTLLTPSPSLLAQPQMGQPQVMQAQKDGELFQKLKAFSLPAGPVMETQVPGITSVIQQAIGKISESLKSQSGSGVDTKTMVSGVETLKKWLTGQGCVKEVTMPYLEGRDNYSNTIFGSYPGEVPINIFFNAPGKGEATQYRLLVFVSNPDVIKFAAINKVNK